MVPGENAAPMHPNCRCSVAAYADREGLDEQFKKTNGEPSRGGLRMNLQFFSINDEREILKKIAENKIDAELFYKRKEEFDKVFERGIVTPIETVYNSNDSYYHIINGHERDIFHKNGVKRIINTLKEPKVVLKTQDRFGIQANSYIENKSERPLLVVVRKSVVTAYVPDENYLRNNIFKKGEKIYDQED